jgi:hypothetical protein
MLILSPSVNKHGRHRPFLFLIGWFLKKIFSSETAWKRRCLFTVHCTYRHDLRNWRNCKWNRCCFEIFWLGNENTRFYLTKTKQSGYYLNLFHESNLLSYLCWLTHPGLNVNAPTFQSRDQYIRETDARNWASVCGLPGWSTVMRTNVLYKDC